MEIKENNMTLWDYAFLHAPSVPRWFYDNNAYLNAKTLKEGYFNWRVYYANEFLKIREKQK